MIVDYENPLKKMMEEFVPHGKVENLNFLSASYLGQVKLSKTLLALLCPAMSILFLCPHSSFLPFFLSLILSSFLSPWSCPLQSLSDALISLQMVYPRRNLSADQWRNAQLLSLISAPSTMLNPAQSDTVSLASL